MAGKICTEDKQTPNGRIQILTIAHKEECNAITIPMENELLEILKAAAVDDTVRGILIRGEGVRSFCAGGSMQNLKKLNTPEDVEKQYAPGTAILDEICTMKKPVVAAVSGWCIGAGFEIALACDLLYASDTAKFRMPEFEMGLFPDWGAAAMLPRRIGLAAAREFLYFGEIMTASEAYEKGLVGKVLEGERVFSYAEEMLTRIIVKPAEAVAAYKQFLTLDFCQVPYQEAKAQIHQSTGALMLGDTFKQVVNSFLEKE